MLAVAVFASMSTLIAALYAAAMDVGLESAGHTRTMTLARVSALAGEQWDERRAVRFDAEGGFGPGIEASFNADAATFYTAAPILFPDWPLVQATYAIEDTDQLRPQSDGFMQRLVYRERRILGFDAPPTDTTGVTPDGRPRAARLVLLDACDRLRFERFGAAVPPPPASAQPASRNEQRPRDTRSADEREERWRPLDGTFGGEIRSVRLVGSTGREVFSCVFATEASR